MRLSFKGLLFPVLLINITTAANLWTLGPVPIGQSLYFLAIGLAFWRVHRSPYRVLGAALMVAAVGLKVASAAQGGGPFEIGVTAAVGLLFTVAGALVYGDDPGRLHRQLMVFFALSVPVLFAQKAGLHAGLLVWNTEVFHANDVYTFDDDDIGSLTYVAPLVKTLFADASEMTYTIAQGRPSGLLYSNNVLSVFLVMAFALNLCVRRRRVTQVADVILALSMALVMSLTVLASAVILMAVYAVTGGADGRRRCAQFLLPLAGALALHWVLFPGITESGFGRAKLITSLVGRFGELSYLLNLSSLAAILDSQATSIGLQFSLQEGASYSLVGLLLRSRLALGLVVVLPLAGLFYLKRLRTVARHTPYAEAYGLFLLAALLSQLGVPYLGAPSFQYLLGFALTPLFGALPMVRRPVRSEGADPMPVSGATARRFPRFFEPDPLPARFHE